MKIAYIHGFQSSSKAKKATILNTVISKDFKDISFIAPDFPDNFQKALSSLEDFVEKSLKEDELCLVGSSLGGFLSILLSMKYNLKVALVNPCLYASKFCLDNKIIGVELENFDTHNKFLVTQDDIEFIKTKEATLKDFDQSKAIVFLQTGDEVLDYTYSQNFFKGCEVLVREGGCHGYDGFEKEVPTIIDFFKKA